LSLSFSLSFVHQNLPSYSSTVAFSLRLTPSPLCSSMHVPLATIAIFTPPSRSGATSKPQVPGLLTLEHLSPDLSVEELRVAFKTLEEQFLKVHSVSFRHFHFWVPCFSMFSA
jgi:hypothetical protein